MFQIQASLWSLFCNNYKLFFLILEIFITRYILFPLLHLFLMIIVAGLFETASPLCMNMFRVCSINYTCLQIFVQKGELLVLQICWAHKFFFTFLQFCISIDRSSVTMKILHTLGEFYGMPTFFAQLLSNFFVICFSVELVKL